MKKLGQYNKFDMKEFLDGKEVTVGAVKPRTGAQGSPVNDGYQYVAKTFIIDDANNEQVNQGEALDIKLKNISNLHVGQTLKFGSGAGEAGLVNAIGSVYGDFRNQLSVKADRLGIHSNEGHR